jgi:transcriptional regulator with XRE-family HTH domain
VVKHLPPVALALRSARAKAKLSQRALAEVSGISRPAIASIELGLQSSVRLATLERLAHSLKCEVSDLMGQTNSDDADIVQAFLGSALAEELAVTPKEKTWLLSLRISWQGRTPTKSSILMLLLAHRSCD